MLVDHTHTYRQLARTPIPHTAMTTCMCTGACTAYATMQYNQAYVHRLRSVHAIEDEGRVRCARAMCEYYGSLVGQYWDALGRGDIDVCIGVKNEIVRMKRMIRRNKHK